jgi:hypothetical protein
MRVTVIGVQEQVIVVLRGVCKLTSVHRRPKERPAAPPRRAPRLCEVCVPPDPQDGIHARWLGASV